MKRLMALSLGIALPVDTHLSQHAHMPQERKGHEHCMRRVAFPSRTVCFSNSPHTLHVSASVLVTSVAAALDSHGSLCPVQDPEPEHAHTHSRSEREQCHTHLLCAGFQPEGRMHTCTQCLRELEAP